MIDTNKMLVITVFVSMYIIPKFILNAMGIAIDQYIFAIVMVVYYLTQLVKSQKISLREIIIWSLIIYFSIINKSVAHIQLLSLIVLDKMLRNSEKALRIVYRSFALGTSIFFILIYTAIRFGEGGRYIFTSNEDTNMTGLSLILLFLLIRAKYKKIGNMLLLLGILTFSRNYLLGLIIFYISDFFVKRRFLFKKLIMKSLRNFKFLATCSVAGLILLSFYFIGLYENGKIVSYESGFQRYTTIADSSNYFRFTINMDLLKIYEKNPRKLFTGISEDDFSELSVGLAKEEGRPYMPIRPHNYFFSYLRIYGIFSIIIFWYLSIILKKIIVNGNIPIFLVIFVYITFLGVGFSSYWLFLSIFALNSYNPKFRDVIRI